MKFPSGLAAIAWRFLRVSRAAGLLLQMHPKSYLRRRGWFRSFVEKRSVDRNGHPVPWWSYGVTDFVEQRVSPSMDVLEFGSGASTGWLAARVRTVVSVETDLAWAETIRAVAPRNVTVVVLPDPREFRADHLGDVADGIDIVVVDAFSNRIECARSGLTVLRRSGVVIWDNTDGPDWPQIRSMMAERGFREISFSGLAPQELSEDRTTIFYRAENVFGI